MTKLDFDKLTDSEIKQIRDDCKRELEQRKIIALNIEKNKYKQSAIDFLDFVDKNKSDSYLDYTSITNVYFDYVDFCQSKGIEPVKRYMFTKLICKISGFKSKVKTIDNNSIRFFDL